MQCEENVYSIRWVTRVLSTWGWGRSFPPKSFTEKKFTAISNKDLFDDDFKESVKVTNAQKFNFSQS